MLTAYLLVFGLIGACFALLAPVLIRLFRTCCPDDITAEWIETFHPSSYYPMDGLLAKEDFQFLARQPGFDLSLYRKLRRERMNIFQQYLRRLISDFNRLYAYVRLAVALTEGDHSALFLRLTKLKIQFMLNVIAVQFRYYLCMAGIGSLAAHSLIASLEDLAGELNSAKPLLA